MDFTREPTVLSRADKRINDFESNGKLGTITISSRLETESNGLCRFDKGTNGFESIGKGNVMLIVKRTNSFDPNGQGNQRFMSIVQENQWF